jgi:hypothetical protein
MRILKTKRSFKKEFKRQIKYAITAAVGFTIAFAWRDAILQMLRDIVEKFTESAKSALISTYSALLITLLGVVVIIFSSKLLRDKR